MTLQAHTLQLPVGARKRPKKRVGRGAGSGFGTTAGRGTKGQKARSGGRGGLKRKGLKPSLQKVPKVRGFRSISPRMQMVTLSALSARCKPNETVTLKLLKKRGLIRDTNRQVKVVATGRITIPIKLQGCLLSKGAITALEKAGGTVVF